MQHMSGMAFQILWWRYVLPKAQVVLVIPITLKVVFRHIQQQALHLVYTHLVTKGQCVRI